MARCRGCQLHRPSPGHRRHRLRRTVWTTSSFDVALGRPLTAVDGGGGGETSDSYAGNDVRMTGRRGSQSFSCQLEYDGRRELASVCRITSVANGGLCAPPTVPCGR